MKKLIALFAVVLIAAIFLWGEQSIADYRSSGKWIAYSYPDTITIDSAYSSDSWELAATVIATSADSGLWLVMASFSVELSKYQNIYWGATNDSSKDVPVYDTAQTGISYDKNKERYFITDWWVDSTIIATAGATDTFFLWMSTGDDVSNIFIENLKMTVTAFPLDSA